MKNLIFLITFFSLNACASNLIKSDNGLFVFVGEQIQLEEFEPNVSEDAIVMDLAFNAQYRIILPVYGAYNGGDTIEFEVYDHYGFPEFAKYKNVLLFVSEGENRIYHQKYQFYDVYKTANGKWATCGNPYEYEDEIEAKPLSSIDFSPRLEYDLSNVSSIYAKQEYPEPIFKIEDSKAVCRKGVYVDELFRIKSQTVLKARGLFSNKKDNQSKQ